MAGSRRILAITIPAIGTLVADPLMGVVDTAVVGRLGAAELGGLGLAVSVLAAATSIFNFLVFGTTSTVARAMGARRFELAGQRVSHAAQVALALGTVIGRRCSSGLRACSGRSAGWTSSSTPPPHTSRSRRSGSP